MAELHSGDRGLLISKMKISCYLAFYGEILWTSGGWQLSRVLRA